MHQALAVISFILWLLPVSSFAATYYVAKTGNNANSCTQAQSQTTPKLTIQAGVNCATGPGDTVIVKAGTYIENVSITGHANDGANGNPKILRANPGDTVTWTISNGSVCTYNVALYMQDISYWRIEGFTFSNVNSRATIRLLQLIDQANKTTPMVGIEILNNTFTNNGTNGVGGSILDCPNSTSGCMSRQIYAQYLGQGSGYSGAPVNTFSGNTFTGNYGENVTLDHTSDTLVSHNTSTNNHGSRESSTSCQYQTNLVSGGTRCVIEDNTVSNIIQDSVPISGPVEGVGIRLDVGQNNNLIRRNIVHDLGNEGPAWNGNRHFFGIFDENNSNDNTFEQNIVYNINEGCMIVGSAGTTVVQRPTIQNNTFYNCGQFGLYLHNASAGTIRNNIFAGNARAQAIVTPLSVTAGGYVFSNNDWYRGGSPFGLWNYDPNTKGYADGTLNLAGWNSASGDTNSISADPLFVNAPSDFHLATTSPARQAGMGGIDMGAYPVYDSTTPLPSPTNLRIVNP